MEYNLLFKKPYNTCENPKPDRQFCQLQELLIRDLKMEVLLDKMAAGDSNLKEICRAILLSPSVSEPTIKLRQEILKDAIRQPDFFSSIYNTIKGFFRQLSNFDDITKPKYKKIIPVTKKLILQCEIAELIISTLKSLANMIKNAERVSASDLKDFCDEFRTDYSDERLNNISAEINNLLALKEKVSITIGCCLGSFLKLTDIKLHEISPYLEKNNDRNLFFSIKKKKVKEYDILLESCSMSDQAREIIDTILCEINTAVTEFNNNVITSLKQLMNQFGFYHASVNLYKTLSEMKIDICFPKVSVLENVFSFKNLKDPFLILKGENTIGNGFSIKDKNLWIITGANQGGKTTFLRSIGINQIMAQCGLFVTASDYYCTLYQSIFTHFPDNEDKDLNNGLLEQELIKLNEIIKYIDKNSLILLNETFLTTTEYDGSYLASEIIDGLQAAGITTIYVTHNYSYAHSLYLKNRSDTIFLKAIRKDDGKRYYALKIAKPERSSFAIDLYQKVIVSKLNCSTKF